jgi:uncharacterized glyoxalase superfamily protein PhnB
VSEERQIFGIAPVLLVADVVKAHDYYAEMLGFRSPRMWGDPPGFCIAKRDGCDVMLSQAEPGNGVHPNGDHEGRIDAYFYVRDADALHAEFKAKGAEIILEPEDQVYGMRETMVRDIDGHVLCFGHDLTGAA